METYSVGKVNAVVIVAEIFVEISASLGVFLALRQGEYVLIIESYDVLSLLRVFE